MTQKEIEQRIAQIRNDREHGSRWLVRETMLLLRDLAQEKGAAENEQMRLLYRVGRELAQARPAMAALSGAVGRILTVEGGPASIAAYANQLLVEYDTAIQHITTYARPYLHGQLLTCSISGTVLEVLGALGGQIERVIALEGRPRYEGRETARLLSRQGLAVTLITDAQADIFLPECQGVVVGADSILANGDVLNKAGTALLGWAASGHNIPFYALCESLKISSRQWSADPAQQSTNMELLEEKEPEEVLEQPIGSVEVHNFYFDRTPHQLVSKVITELGVLEQQAVEDIARKVRDNEQMLSRKSDS
jgi:ribose 1,5-bisphosphate isomerase